METFDELLASVYSLMVAGDLDTALIKAREAVYRNRLNLTANLMLATILFQQENWLESYRYYGILSCLQQKYKEQVIADEELAKIVQSVWNKAMAMAAGWSHEKEKEYRDLLFETRETVENLLKNRYTEVGEIPGLFGQHIINGKRYYFGKYDDWAGVYYRRNNNLPDGKVCILEMEKRGKEYIANDGFPFILPVVANPASNRNDIAIEIGGKKEEIFLETTKRAFSYYRIQEPIRITSQEEMIFAKPIFLKQKMRTHKKLVINIFLDSLNWCFINKHSLKELMPHTYDFFNDGVICEQYYAGSEFTYPSLASYWTGLRPAKHMMLSQEVHFPLLSEHTLLTEIFQDNGYYVSIIGGNAGATPDYGYLRGVDRFLTGRAEQNFHTQDVVCEAIEQMEALPEISQFMWLDIQDLHEVAGYWGMPFSVQSNVGIETNVVDNKGGSSLYQTPSPHRREVYTKQLRRIDIWLNALYIYLNEHYNRDEIVVTLMSDHGNGFNVEANQPFMSEQRINVPLMIRGCNAEKHICNEKIETIDYGHILCKLAQIDDGRLEKNDGQLPVFFGGENEKTYVFAQSLYPNRPYAAAILGEGFKFYFSSEKLVGNDCRIDISSGSYLLVDDNDEAVEDSQLVDECLKVMMIHLGDYLSAENVGV